VCANKVLLRVSMPVVDICAQEGHLYGKLKSRMQLIEASFPLTALPLFSYNAACIRCCM
jgi:hypothetical protein